MESTAFFEKKVSLTPSDLNEIKFTPLEELLMKRAKAALEGKCSEQGFVLPGSVELLSRSMGYFEAARFTGDANYYLKLKWQVIYPVEGIEVVGKVIRKNKMGIYVNYKDAIRIQIPRDLHLDRPDFEEVRVGDEVEVVIKRSKFAIHDTFILASGIFIDNQTVHENANSIESNMSSMSNMHDESNLESNAESNAESNIESNDESNEESLASEVSEVSEAESEAESEPSSELTLSNVSNESNQPIAAPSTLRPLRPAAR